MQNNQVGYTGAKAMYNKLIQNYSKNHPLNHAYPEALNTKWELKWEPNLKRYTKKQAIKAIKIKLVKSFHQVMSNEQNFLHVMYNISHTIR